MIKKEILLAKTGAIIRTSTFYWLIHHQLFHDQPWWAAGSPQLGADVALLAEHLRFGDLQASQKTLELGSLGWGLSSSGFLACFLLILTCDELFVLIALKHLEWSFSPWDPILHWSCLLICRQTSIATWDLSSKEWTPVIFCAVNLRHAPNYPSPDGPVAKQLRVEWVDIGSNVSWLWGSGISKYAYLKKIKAVFRKHIAEVNWESLDIERWSSFYFFLHFCQCFQVLDT